MRSIGTYNRVSEIITYTVDDGFTISISKLSRCTNENYTNLAMFLVKAILQLCRIIFVLSGSARRCEARFCKVHVQALHFWCWPPFWLVSRNITAGSFSLLFLQLQSLQVRREMHCFAQALLLQGVPTTLGMVRQPNPWWNIGSHSCN